MGSYDQLIQLGGYPVKLFREFGRSVNWLVFPFHGSTHAVLVEA